MTIYNKINFSFFFRLGVIGISSRLFCQAGKQNKIYQQFDPRKLHQQSGRQTMGGF
jgi:hypothetical protein